MADRFHCPPGEIHPIDSHFFLIAGRIHDRRRPRIQRWFRDSIAKKRRRPRSSSGMRSSGRWRHHHDSSDDDDEPCGVRRPRASARVAHVQPRRTDVGLMLALAARRRTPCTIDLSMHHPAAPRPPQTRISGKARAALTLQWRIPFRTRLQGPRRASFSRELVQPRVREVARRPRKKSISYAYASGSSIQRHPRFDGLPLRSASSR